MKIADLLRNINIVEAHADVTKEITGISYDSRTTQPGNVFIAVKGFESDGHEFIGDALKKGAVCILCQNKPTEDTPYIITDNTRRGLAVAATNWFNNPSAELKIIGVTGTNGKTTTSMLIKTMIEKCTGATVGLIGTNNNLIGTKVLEAHRTTPESYELQQLFRRMVDDGCTYAVMEVSSHALALDRAYGIMFEVGVFTNLTHEHLDFHETMEAYADAKAILFKQSRHAVINLDDSVADKMIAAATGDVLTFSTEKDTADLVGKRIRVFSNKVDFCALTMEKLQNIEMNIPARFTVFNALAACATGLALGFEIEAIAEALKTASGVKGRIEVVPTGRDFTVIIDYAHKPFALENIIQAFKELETGRVVTLFGCGGDRDAAKRPMMGEIAARLSDFVIVTSDNPRTEDPDKIIEDILAGMKNTKTPFKVIQNRKEAIGWAIEHAQPNDIIVLAGKGHETYQILGKEKIQFDEREIVKEFLSAVH